MKGRAGLGHSRPTAVNLADAARKLTWLAQQEAAQEDASPESVTLAVVSAAEAMLEDDIAANRVRFSDPAALLALPPLPHHKVSDILHILHILHILFVLHIEECPISESLDGCNDTSPLCKQQSRFPAQLSL